jgi:hypothetical protein
MLSPSTFRHRLERKKTKDIEKEEHLQAIKSVLNLEFNKFSIVQPSKAVPILDSKKLRKEYNFILFQNMLKERKIADLEAKILSFKRIKRSSSVEDINQVHISLRITEIVSDLERINSNIEEELYEKEQLLGMLEKQKKALVLEI